MEGLVNVGENKSMKLPFVPLRGLIIFPKMTLQFDAGRYKTVNALEEAMKREQIIFLSTQIDITEDVPGKNSVYSVGTVARIRQMIKLPGGNIRVLVEGLCRAKTHEIYESENFDEVTVECFEENRDDSIKNEALYRKLIDCFEEYSKLNKKIPQQVIINVMACDNAGQLADLIASNIYLKRQEKQELLECVDIEERVEKLASKLISEIDILKVEMDIDNKVKNSIDRVQREFHLKEQLKAIRSELGYVDEDKDDITEYKEKLSTLELPKDVQEKVNKEINRLSRTSSNSPEYTVIRNYLDLLLELPWNNYTEDNFELDNAKRVLNQQHYGLEKVKERIIEFLAVKKLKNDMEGPILCLVGPPGVGKTSIAKSIAEALGRKFVRMSLGGVRDESEIRGHRKTYIGAMPGRIISSIGRVKSNNPVFLLDEIDKMSSDSRGDAVSAMLEVLDYEQNISFRDNYLELTFDLSKFLFIATANSLETIPAPLRDRMEIIYLSGYTTEEKMNIAIEHLTEKQLKNHGIKAKVKIDNEAIYEIIEGYTREAGVRTLERNIAGISRKLAVIFADSNKKSITIKKKDVEKYLGPRKFENNIMEDADEVGLVKGLAWTSVGGDTLDIETVVLNGSGRIELTGHLGDVMKESARTAVSYIRSKSKELGLEEDFYKKYDIHVHVPEGAVPKDGPSAGITIATSIVSALKDYSVRRDVAMTGEITLRGRVLAIGGLKEKVTAAYRIGITTIICPKANKKDIIDIPKAILEKVKFIYVDHVDDVFKAALREKSN